VTCLVLARELKAVNSISATSASLIQAWACSSQTALVYLIGVHPSFAMASIARRIGGLRRAVIEKQALRRSTAAITSEEKNAESARSTSVPVAPAFFAVIRASATNRWAPFALLVEPLRRRAAAMTGRLVGVLMIASSTFRPLIPV